MNNKISTANTISHQSLTDKELVEKYFARSEVGLCMPIPHNQAYRDEAYRTFIEFLKRYAKLSSRVLSTTVAMSFGWDKYWNTWCIEEALRRGDIVRAGKKVIRFVHGTILPKTPEEIRDKLAEIEAKIAAGGNSAKLCAEYGITPQRLGNWRRDFGKPAPEPTKELGALREEIARLKEKLAVQGSELNRLHALSKSDSSPLRAVRTGTGNI